MNRIIRVLLIAGMALWSLTLQAQNARLRAANKQFDDLSYANAVRGYEEFLRVDKKKDPADTRDALLKLGYSYRKLQDTRNAERIYGELVKDYSDLESEVYLYYAQSLAANGKYRESQKLYSQYGEKQSKDLRGRRFTVSYMDMSRFYQDSSSFQVQSLPLNSRQADFSPMYYKGGLVFVSARDESGVIKRVFNWNQTPFLDLYFHPDTAQLRIPGGELVVPASAAILGGGGADEVVPADAAAGTQPLSKAEVFSRTLNTKYHEGPMTFTRDQNFIVFTRNNSSKGKSGKSSDGIRKLKLYSSANVSGKWVDVKELPFNNSDYSVGHPAFSPDDSQLYFVSDMPGGYGGTDIYVVEYRGGEWGTPVNMGKEINTEGNEMFPFIDEGGNLYFSSDGHEGLGGLDVFFAELRDGVAYRGVQNTGAPINSEKDDFGFITDRSRTNGYFSSNRKKGVSDDDIYAFRRICKQLNIFVYDAKTSTPLENADVRILRNGANQELKLTNLSGQTELCVDANTEYEFKAIKEGFAMNSIRFSTLTQSPKSVMNVSIYLERTENTLLKGIVKTEVNQLPATGVKVTLRNEKDKSEQTVVTGPDGGYEFSTKANAPYTITAQKDQYATKKAQFNKTKRTNKPVTDSLSLYGVGDVFELENIYYDLNKFFIRPDAARELDRVVELLNEYPKMQIELRSHTDARATDTYNIRLSENRARAAMGYLVSRGIQPDRLLARGLGETEILNGCADGVSCSERQHQRNRRTEFKILAVQ
ncbi:OmpA family protein [Spirosoma utsteinense]|uniref:Outer membrane protein OmpA-like peptidoglycan-associated protein n=1 Tax=Spirosoma utsteinense TaxID=2585773 RepID=A0ABR6VZQ3_9BACT|nr:OmpA family protein [Spirosoma utsteinense]MBC3784491.1 outer membrane protein OmpA-like peptidoglycan-associated protein [Spirosoma utsteinense]MBC3789759.1 outer membrane protein OmpA-like peptidoglycan-associated protein [Spirosoma utsteinense]